MQQFGRGGCREDERTDRQVRPGRDRGVTETETETESESDHHG
jgi:hypothetical protein